MYFSGARSWVSSGGLDGGDVVKEKIVRRLGLNSGRQRMDDLGGLFEE